MTLTIGIDGVLDVLISTYFALKTQMVLWLCERIEQLESWQNVESALWIFSAIGKSIKQDLIQESVNSKFHRQLSFQMV